MAALLGLISPFLAVAQPKTTFSVRIVKISSLNTPSSAKLAYLLGSLISVTLLLTACSLVHLALSLFSEGLEVRAIASEATKFAEAASTAVVTASLSVTLQLALDALISLTVLGVGLYKAMASRLLSYLSYAILYAVRPPGENPLTYIARYVVTLKDPLGLLIFTLSIVIYTYSMTASGFRFSSALKASLAIVAARLALTIASLLHVII